MYEIQDVPVLVRVGRLPRLQRESAVVEGQPAEGLRVGVVGVELAVGLLAAPFRRPLGRRDVAGGNRRVTDGGLNITEERKLLALRSKFY